MPNDFALTPYGGVLGSYSFSDSCYKQTHNIVFYANNKPALTINFDVSPPTVDLHGNEPAESAKLFWDQVANLVGLPSPVK